MRTLKSKKLGQCKRRRQIFERISAFEKFQVNHYHDFHSGIIAVERRQNSNNILREVQSVWRRNHVSFKNGVGFVYLLQKCYEKNKYTEKKYFPVSYTKIEVN